MRLRGHAGLIDESVISGIRTWTEMSTEIKKLFILFIKIHKRPEASFITRSGMLAATVSRRDVIPLPFRLFPGFTLQNIPANSSL
jgi:hypothetical protein